jgi:hypothetical protein
MLLPLARIALTFIVAAACVTSNDVGAETAPSRWWPALDLPGTVFTFSPHAETGGGYDSNLDGLRIATGSTFETIEAGVALKAALPDQVYTLRASQREFNYDDLVLSRRWEFNADVDAAYKISPSQSLDLGTGFRRDYLHLSPADIYRSLADYTHTSDLFRLRVKAKSLVEVSRSTTVTDFDGDDDGSGYGDEDAAYEFNTGGEYGDAEDNHHDQGIPGDKTYNYARSEGHIALSSNTNAIIRPFIIANYADLKYFDQLSNPLIDRNAREIFGITGVRIEFDKTFRIDIGARANRREFDDRRVADATNADLDLNVRWQPSSGVTLTGTIEHYFKEPAALRAVADDVRSFGLTLEWRPNAVFRIKADAYLDQVTPVGDNLYYEKIGGQFHAIYEPSKNVEIFASALGRTVTEEINNRTYDRYRIGGGVRIKY